MTDRSRRTEVDRDSALSTQSEPRCDMDLAGSASLYPTFDTYVKQHANAGDRYLSFRLILLLVLVCRWSTWLLFYDTVGTIPLSLSLGKLFNTNHGSF